MNLHLYCQTVMLRQNQHGKEMKLKRKGFYSSLHPVLTFVDSTELHITSIYSKTTNSFSHTPPYLRSQTGGDPSSLPALSPGSPLTRQHRDDSSPGRTLAKQAPGRPFGQCGQRALLLLQQQALPACKAAIPPKPTHSFRE